MKYLFKRDLNETEKAVVEEKLRNFRLTFTWSGDSQIEIPILFPATEKTLGERIGSILENYDESLDTNFDDTEIDRYGY